MLGLGAQGRPSKQGAGQHHDAQSLCMYVCAAARARELPRAVVQIRATMNNSTASKEYLVYRVLREGFSLARLVRHGDRRERTIVGWVQCGRG